MYCIRIFFCYFPHCCCCWGKKKFPVIVRQRTCLSLSPPSVQLEWVWDKIDKDYMMWVYQTQFLLIATCGFEHLLFFWFRLSLIVNLPPSSSQSVELANQGQVRIYRRVYTSHVLFVGVTSIRAFDSFYFLSSCCCRIGYRTWWCVFFSPSSDQQLSLRTAVFHIGKKRTPGGVRYGTTI
jgi:hypothetical protein